MKKVLMSERHRILKTKTPIMKHDLNNYKEYPSYHQFLSTPNTINLFSNTEVNIGDTIILPEGEFNVTKITNLQDEEAIDPEASKETLKGGKAKYNSKGIPTVIEDMQESVHFTEDTLFYNLKIERNGKEIQ